MAWSMRVMWAGSSSIGTVLKSILPAFPPGNRDVGMHRDTTVLNGLPQLEVFTHLLVKIHVRGQAIPHVGSRTLLNLDPVDLIGPDLGTRTALAFPTCNSPGRYPIVST